MQTFAAVSSIVDALPSIVLPEQKLSCYLCVTQLAFIRYLISDVRWPADVS